MAEQELRKWASSLNVTGPKYSEIVRGILSLNERTAQYYLKCPTIDKESKSAVDHDFQRRFPALCEQYEKTFWPNRKAEVAEAQKAMARSSNLTNNSQKGDGKAAHLRKNAFLIEEVQRELVNGGKTLGELRLNIQKRITNVQIREEDILIVLQSTSLDVEKVRDLWALSKTGNEAEDA